MSTFLVDLKNTVVSGLSNPPAAAVTADVTTGSTAVDLLTAEGPVHVIIAAGATDFASLDETYAFQLYESDASGGTYTAISGATASVTAANTVAIISTGQRTKRYVKVYLDTGGTTPSIIYSSVVLAKKKITGTGAGSVTTTA
jgi:hypothetical protein